MVSKCINRVELKEKNIFTTKFNLPPNVNGQCRGRLTLCLNDIYWINDGPSNFDTIHAKIVWWGDVINSSATLKLRNKLIKSKSVLTNNVVHYNILTKLKLFRNYLISSDGIELRFTTGISNITIGSAIVPIPEHLIKFIDKNQLSERIVKSRKTHIKCKIINSHKKIIGHVNVSFDLIISNSAISEKELNHSAIATVSTNQHEIDIENKPIAASKLKKSKKEKNYLKKTATMIESLKSIKISSKNQMASPFIEYLSGKMLDDYDKDRIMKSMEQISPSESLIDLLTVDLDCLYGNQLDKLHLKQSNQIDSVRLNIYELNLTKAGVREILNEDGCNHNIFTSGTFIVDVVLESATIKTDSIVCNAGTTFVSEVSNIFTSDVLPPPVHFDNYYIQKLNGACDVIHLTFWFCHVISNKTQKFGIAQIKLNDIATATNLTYKKQCLIQTCTGGVIVGQVSVQIELGCRELHFGNDYLDAISLNRNIHDYAIDDSILYSPNLKTKSILCDVKDRLRLDDYTYRSCAHDEQSKRSTDHHQSTASNTESTSTPNQYQPPLSSNQNGNNTHSHFVSESFSGTDGGGDTLQGLFYVGQCNSLQATNETVLICRPFWMTEQILVTDNYLNQNDDIENLNYLELFNVLSNDQLIKSTKHNFMNIELWQQEPNQLNTMIGIAKVSLHQFFIAFNNAHIRNHVTKQKIPVISIDGWVTFTSMATGKPIGTMQVTLAVGTIEQIAKFKLSKNLTACKSFRKLPSNAFSLEQRNGRDVAPPQPPQQQMPEIEQPLQSSIRNDLNTLKCRQSLTPEERQANLASMLSNFIENLALKLPERNAAIQKSNSTVTESDVGEKTENSNLNVASNNKSLRPTSELLDELQRALSIAPAPPQQVNQSCNNSNNSEKPASTTSQQPIEQLSIPSQSEPPKMFRVHIKIDCALHLPAEPDKQPNVYASFQAYAPDSIDATNPINYTTNVIENSSSPQWNQQYEVKLPVEFLLNDEKRFPLHIWYKTLNNDDDDDDNGDFCVGSVSIDLTVLVVCLPSIEGWFNIIDNSGRINGQIKVQIKPDALDVAPFTSDTREQLHQIRENSPIANALFGDFDDFALSRALKRKFTELEEITQRLRARLFDVTGDSDDQFESDLNTVPDES